MNVSKANINKVNTLNIFLILISLLFAFILPFSLFLFSYAILGPLHYMTEINWLNDKNYFIKKRSWIWFFIFMAFLISIPPVLHLSFFSFEGLPEMVKGFVYLITTYTDIILLTMLLFAIGAVFLKKNWHTALFLVLSGIMSKLIISYVLGSYILVGIFLPTIIHVYLFTFLFMLLGVLNSKNVWGWIGLILMLLTPFIIYYIQINPNLFLTTESEETISTAKNFRFINYIASCFNATQSGQIISLSVIGIKIQTFVAFCYTYHYLNWFSKTSIIGWRKNISRNKFIFILIVWIAAITLFMYNYELAYLALFFLTILHIVLEFPLNIICIKEIFSKIKTSFI